MVARRHDQGWEPWEARRASLPKRASWEERQAREDVRLLLMVVRARLREGTVPVEHIEALARFAEDERISHRLRIRAAQALAECRMRGLDAAGPEIPDTRQPRKPRRRRGGAHGRPEAADRSQGDVATPRRTNVTRGVLARPGRLLT